MKHKLVIAASAAAALTGALILPAVSATAQSTGPVHTAISNRPDGGNNDNPAPGTDQTWANDNFTRTATVSLSGSVSPSHCPGDLLSVCYAWTGHINDTGALLGKTSGSFTTNPTADSGAYSPGAGTGGTGATGLFSLGVSAKGSFFGHANYTFFTDANAPDTGNVLVTEDDAGSLPSGDHTTSLWVEQFFPNGTNFWDTSGSENPGSLLTGNWSWTYTLGLGKDSDCPNVASKWIDASFNNFGDDPVDGNILAPDGAHC